MSAPAAPQPDTSAAPPQAPPPNAEQSKSWLKLPNWFDLFLWLDLLQGPKEPPFAKQTNFNEEAKKFWQIFFISAVLTGFSVVLGTEEKFSLSPVARYFIGGIAVFAILYCLGLARFFRIDITIRQTFFVFGFLLFPWIPIFSFIIFAAGHFKPLAPMFVLMLWMLPWYIVWSIAKGISIVSDSSKLRCVLSVSLLVIVIEGLTVYIVLFT
jgi:hypothetical protein